MKADDVSVDNNVSYGTEDIVHEKSIYLENGSVTVFCEVVVKAYSV